MIYSLNGVLIDRNLSSVVIECGGVGYKCIVTDQTLRQLPEIGSKLFLYTYMNVREDAVDLFGFITKDEMEMFRLLISVNGVGPKAAIAILSEMQPDKLSFCIAAGDAKAITKAQGVGPKLAQRIVRQESLSLVETLLLITCPATIWGRRSQHWLHSVIRSRRQ